MSNNKFISNNGKIVLYNDDCMSVMKKLDKGSIDLIITDPHI